MAPFALVTHEDARPRARAIATAVQAKQMPPWLPGPQSKGVFANERGLSAAQIATLVAWARTGAQPGALPAAAKSPAAAATGLMPTTPPEASTVDGWSLGEPDIDVVSDVTALSDDTAEDMVTYEVGELPRDLWVQGIEFKAGSAAVHHICAAAVLPIGRFAPGFDRETSLGCSAPGSGPRRLPDGYAYRLPRGAAIRLDIHYFKARGAGTAVSDTSHVGLTLARSPVTHRVRFNAVGNTTFEVPPGHTDWHVGAARVFAEATTLLSLWPHGHARAVAARYTAFYPDGRREVLLDVPRYDYRWQETYDYRTPKPIPAGTRIEVEYRYDNSAARGARRKFDAALPVRFGAHADDEMMLGYLSYVEVAGMTDAVDTDRLLRASVSPPGRDDIALSYPKLAATADGLGRLEALKSGETFQFPEAASLKLRIGVDLRLGQTLVKAGNVGTGYVGLYGVWLQRTATGWALALTSRPDVWGTQFEPATRVALVPLQHTFATASTDTLAVRFDNTAENGTLVLTWGSHVWSARVAFTPAGRNPAVTGASPPGAQDPPRHRTGH